jgi:4-amino-4-deoxy-L-arabinose transferase-like glycosyltransferase
VIPVKAVSPRAALKYVLFLTLAVKFVLAGVVPLSGDEAYFLVWAHHPDFGFYDHPPMAGWILQGLLAFGSSEVVLRLPAILLSTVIGWGIYELMKPYDETRAALAAMLFLVSPLNIVNVLITTDTPLILFVFLSATALYKAQQKNSLAGYALSGALLGLAFLSKYFAVLLGLVYLAYFVFSGRRAQMTRGFALLFAAALPFALVNLYWNYTHCWDNILFNLYNRNEGEESSAGKVAVFLGTQLYLMTPPVIYYLYKHRAGLMQLLNQGPFKLFGWAFWGPMAIFALLSVKKDIGLHWVLAFYPFLYLLLFYLLSQEELYKSLKFMAWLSIAHLAAIAVIAYLPMETWQKNKLYDGIVFMFRNDEIAGKVRPYEARGFVLAADGYTPAAIISYHYGRNFAVFGEGSHYARQDDIITDFREFAGRNILIVKKSAPEMAQYAPYFKQVGIERFELRGVNFYFVLGYGFDYGKYRDNVLRSIKDKYYAIPGFLPHAPCYFCEKYFPEESR